MSLHPDILAVIEGRSQWCVVTGDCLQILPTIPAGSIDGVICDPPYSINTKSDGAGKLSPWADCVNAAFWYAEWFRESRRVLNDRGALWSCLNWRSLVTFQKASMDIGWPIESLAVWDKCWIGPGGSKGLRPSYEMVSLWCKGEGGVDDRGIPDVVRVQWSSHKPTGHPAEKPVELMSWCVEATTHHNDIVLDPFLGSGATGVAAIQSGRRFIGIEMDPDWSDSSRRRIADAAPLFVKSVDTKPEPALFGEEA